METLLLQTLFVWTDSKRETEWMGEAWDTAW